MFVACKHKHKSQTSIPSGIHKYFKESLIVIYVLLFIFSSDYAFFSRFALIICFIFCNWINYNMIFIKPPEADLQIRIVFYLSTKTNVVCSQKNRLNETVLLSTLNKF